MSEHNFLQAIIDNPADDGPRLVYADWLEEHGECQRAEFIRLQLQLGMLGHGDWVDFCAGPHSHSFDFRYEFEWRDRRDALMDQSRRLLDATPNGRQCVPNWHRWGYPVLRGINATPTFWRGFVDEISCSWKVWSEMVAILQGKHPIRRVALIDMPVIAYAFGPGDDGCVIGHFAGFKERRKFRLNDDFAATKALWDAEWGFRAPKRCGACNDCCDRSPVKCPYMIPGRPGIELTLPAWAHYSFPESMTAWGEPNP